MIENDFLTLVMYPELQKRRSFVHNAFSIAKLSENLELKIATLIDPHMYVEQNEIKSLLFSWDDNMVDLVLRRPV